MTGDQFCNFDGCRSAPEAQQVLQAGGLTSTPRLITRLLLLHRSGVRISWSALEVLLGGHEEVLLSPLWQAQPRAEAPLGELLQPLGIEIRSREGRLELLNADELWLESQETALVPVATQSLVQSMVRREGNEELTQWPDSWRIVADAEESSRILEHLRSAFRHCRLQAQSPAALLWLALKRRRPEITREVARLTYEYLDPDAGRHLEALFSASPQQAIAALRQLRTARAQGWDLAFLVGLLQILWDQTELREDILELLQELTPLWLEQPHLVLGWWEECLSQAGQLDTTLVQKLAQISLHWGRAGVDLTALLLRRLEKGLTQGERLLASWLLVQGPLTSEVREVLTRQVMELAQEPNLGGQARVRVEQILEGLGSSALEPLLREYFPRLVEDLRCWLVAQAHRHPGLWPLAEERALAEVVSGSRRMLRQLASLGWQPQGLSEEMTWGLAGFLEQEIPHLEEPDDDWAIALLVRLDPEVTERLYLQARRDVEISSRAFPARLEMLGKHCAAAERPPSSSQLQLLLDGSSSHFLRNELWRGWAQMFRCQSLDSKIREQILEFLGSGKERFPGLWPQWWEIIQRSRDPHWRDWAEQGFLEALRSKDLPRVTVQSLLDGLARRVDRWGQLQALVQVLSQKLLFRTAELTPQDRLRTALSRQAEGDGILSPQAWDVEQRDQALSLLGRLALRTDLEESLRRPLRVRCWQFLRDWLEGVARGGDSYQHRSMPLWTTARQLLPHSQAAEAPLVDELCQLVLSLEASCPDRLRLLTHSDCLGFVLDWSLADASRQREVLQMMQQLLVESDRDYRPVAVGYLLGVPGDRLHPAVRGEWQRLCQRWEGWLYGGE